MRPKIVAFDTYFAHVVGKLPAWHRRWFHWLGVATIPVVWCAIIAGLILLGVIPKTSLREAVLVIALVPLETFLKLLIRRKRPPTIYANRMKIKTSSFPSGHSYGGMLGLGYLAYLATIGGLAFLALPLLLLVFVIGVSRIHLGAHYPSDVVAGWTLGAVVLGLILVFAH